MNLTVEEHPLLSLGAFVTRFDAPISTIETPGEIRALRRNLWAIVAECFLADGDCLTVRCDSRVELAASYRDGREVGLGGGREVVVRTERLLGDRQRSRVGAVSVVPAMLLDVHAAEVRERHADVGAPV